MRYTDHHVHTNFSGDCKIPMEKMIQSAIHKGQSSIILTDHVDYDFPDASLTFEIDFQLYNEKLNEMRHLYPKIEIRKGVEIGYQPHLKNRIEKLVAVEKFDFIINSLHACDGLDYMNGDFFRGKSKDESYNRYFESLLECVETFDTYDVIGHLDFIIRYAPYKERLLAYSQYKQIIDKILSVLIYKDKGIEVNTSGKRYGLKLFHPQRAILKRYHELGGRLITVGSDAHMDKDIQADFLEAFMMLQAIGFKEVVEFKSRNAYMIEIKKIVNTFEEEY